MRRTTFLFFLGTAILSLMICLFNLESSVGAYKFIFLQPFVWLLCYTFLLNPLLRMERFKITIYSNITLTWLTFVVTPAFTILSNDCKSEDIYIDRALFLMIYGLIVTSFIFYIVVIGYARRDSQKEALQLTKVSKGKTYSLGGNKVVYFAYILLSIVVYVIFGRRYDLIRFFIVDSGGEAFTDTTSTIQVLIRTIITGAVVFSFLLITEICAQKYNRTSNKKYVFIALISGMINVGIIIGQRRSAQIYTSLIVIFVLVHLFKNHQKVIIGWILGAAFIAIIGMSVYKHFNVAGVGSYREALSNNSLDLDFISRNMNLYFHGLKETAKVFDFVNAVELDIRNLIYDIFRSTFGISFFVKGQYVTSEIFNIFIYPRMQTSGHTLHSFMYGYIFFGAILSPILTTANVIISVKLESWFNSTRYFDVRYIVGVAMVRFCTALYGNTASLWSYITIYMGTTGLVCLVALIFNKRISVFAKGL